MSNFTDHLQQQVTLAQQKAFAESTNKNFKTQWKSYILFVLHANLQLVPASASATCLYVMFLKQSKLSYATIKNYLNGLRVFHLCHGFSFTALNSFEVRLVLQSIKRELHQAPLAKLAITPQILLDIAKFINLEAPQDYVAWTAMLIGFFSFLRKSNLVPKSAMNFDTSRHLSRNNVRRTPKGLKITLSSSKTIQFHQRNLELHIADIPMSPLNPVAAWDYMVFKIPTSSPDAPAFLIPHGNTLRSMTHASFTKKLKDFISLAGLNPRDYSGHSLRRGGCTFAFQAGVPVDLIRTHGDWRSDAYQQYLEITSDTKEITTTRMAQAIQTLNVQ